MIFHSNTIDIEQLRLNGHCEVQVADLSVFSKCSDQYKKFFNLTLPQKMKYWQGDAPIPFRGYFPPKKQNYDENGRILDLKEGFDTGRDLLTQLNRQSTLHFFGQNIWPNEVPNLEFTSMQTLETFREVANEILNRIGKHLEDAGFHQNLKDLFTRPIETLRVLHYESFDGSSNEFAPVVQHKDPGFLTLIFSIGPGPEYKDLEGPAWHPTDYGDGKIFINVGRTLEQLSSGYFRAPLHRLLSLSKSRLSLCYFFNPNYDAQIKPIGSATEFCAGRQIFCCSVGYSENEEALYQDQIENRVW